MTRYRYPKVNHSEVVRLTEKMGKHAGRALLFSFISIFLHTTNLTDTEIAVFGLRIPIQGQQTVQGGICFLVIFYTTLFYLTSVEAVVAGALRRTLSDSRFWLAVSKNSQSRRKYFPKDMTPTQEAKYVKRFAVVLQNFFLIPITVAILPCVVVVVVGILVSVDDLFFVIISVFSASYF